MLVLSKPFAGGYEPHTTDQEPIWTDQESIGRTRFRNNYKHCTFNASPPASCYLRNVILTVTKMGLPETLLWRARAGQARRVAGMLSPRDAALLEVYARECEDTARAASIESARVNTRLSVDIQRRDDQSFRSLVRGRLPNQAA